MNKECSNIRAYLESQSHLVESHYRIAERTVDGVSSHRLHQIGHIDGHLINLSIVELLNVVQSTLVLISDKVDGHTFATKAASSANPAKQNEKSFIISHFWLNCNMRNKRVFIRTLICDTEGQLDSI